SRGGEGRRGRRGCATARVNYRVASQVAASSEQEAKVFPLAAVRRGFSCSLLAATCSLYPDVMRRFLLAIMLLAAGVASAAPSFAPRLVAAQRHGVVVLSALNQAVSFA